MDVATAAASTVDTTVSRPAGSTGPPGGVLLPADRATVVLLKLAAAADQLLANADAATRDLDGLRNRLQGAVAEAWAVLGPHRRPGGGRVRLPWLPVYTSDCLPENNWGRYRKNGVTRMARIDGPFAARTLDGNIAFCDDGWLAVDRQGHPYPVADAAHTGVYERVLDRSGRG